MSNLWDQLGVPHKGWRCVNVIDMEEAIETCEMCGHENIRYVHYMQNHDYPEELGVGCVCAEKMTGDYVNPKLKEKRLKSRAGRKARWLSRKWKTSRNGNPYLKVDGVHIVIFVFKHGWKKGKFGYKVDDIWGDRAYETVEETQLASFDDFWKLINEDEGSD